MGVVYLAHNVLMNRPEVLKVVHRTLLDRQPEAAERFLREIRAVARLRHENVVQAYSAVQAGDALVLAMEYVEGEDLGKVVRREGPLPMARACRYVAQAAAGLQHAHEQGMAHRDIKPHNLILSGQGRDVVKVLDFGLAKAVGPCEPAAELTEEGALLGTPAYMAPEQAEDAATADIRADIYALGCTLHFLLTGHAPFTGKSRLAVLRAHASGDAPPASRLRPDVPAALDAVIARMMAKDPARRYQTPQEIAHVLEPFTRTATSAAPRPPAPWAVDPNAATVDDGPALTPSQPPTMTTPLERPRAAGRTRRWLVAGSGVVALAVVLYFLVNTLFKQNEPNANHADSKKPPPVVGPPGAAPAPADAPFDAAAAKKFQQQWATHLGVAVVREVDLGGGETLKLMLIPPGSFVMGAADDLPWDTKHEKPQHPVTITRPFYLGVFPVTHKQYTRVTGLKNPSLFFWVKESDGAYPVEQVSRPDALAFCQALSDLDKKRPPGSKYNLPTEAQWEFACRAGTTTPYFFGDDHGRLDEFAWYGPVSGSVTHPVGLKKPNAWGLHEMLGNVANWCADSYEADFYQKSPRVDPENTAATGKFASRGSSWSGFWFQSRSTCRDGHAPDTRSAHIGIRVALLLPGPPVGKAGVP
jgi:serine/threonine protein kinase/formylglycine-generating enzyme required for sulfatase activity